MLSLWKNRNKNPVWRVLADALGHFNDDDGWAMASHVALSALMAVFPFLIFVTALAAFIGNADLANRVADLMFATWPREVATPIASEIHRVVSQARGGLLTLSIVVTIYLASNGVEAARTALNRAYRVTEDRFFLYRRAQSILFVILGAVASLALAFLGLLWPVIFDQVEAYFPAIEPFAARLTLARYIVTGALLVVALTAAHVWLPSRRPQARRLWPGLVVTMALWLVTTLVFSYYLRRFANYAATYAGLASLVTAIFFLYLVAVIMIFGAEFNAALGRLRDERLKLTEEKATAAAGSAAE